MYANTTYNHMYYEQCTLYAYCPIRQTKMSANVALGLNTPNLSFAKYIVYTVGPFINERKAYYKKLFCYKKDYYIQNSLIMKQ